MLYDAWSGIETEKPGHVWRIREEEPNVVCRPLLGYYGPGLVCVQRERERAM